MKKKLENFFDLFVGIGFLLLSIFLLIALGSYNETDNSLSAISNSEIIFNKMGLIGALVSDIFLQTLGFFVSYCIITLLAFMGLSYISYKNKTKERYNAYLKIIMFIVFVLSSCGLVGKFIENSENTIKSGGSVGLFLNSITFHLNDYFLSSMYAVCIIFSLNILTDFDHKKFYGLVKRIFIMQFVVIKFFLVLVSKLFVKILPNALFHKVKMLSVAHKNKKDEAKRIIDNQNKKIELLEKYILENKNSERIQKINKEYGVDLLKLMEKSRKEKQKNITTFDNYKTPPLSLLNNTNEDVNIQTKEELKLQATDLIRVLDEYKIKGKIVSIKAGPIITLHEFEPAPGIKSSRIICSADDIARNLKVKSARISVIPERNVLGIELPNRYRNTVFLKDILDSNEYKNSSDALPIILGVNIGGEPVVIDLAKCPHLLIAGTTGSGKSVAINTMILSLLYRFGPEECKFMMIDPKILELSVYQNIPHLLTPVISDPKKVVSSLKWIVNEMENRYRIMSSLGVRNIYGYNEKICEAIQSKKPLKREIMMGYDKNGNIIYDSVDIELKIMPFIVIIVDEMAELMLTVGKDMEALIQRIAQMARAAGIHIIMATQRPSTNVITGVIKANFPSKISFLVSSKIDSRVVLGEQGAEQLLGFGDMLYSANGGKISRAHGPFVSDAEVRNVIDFILKQNIKPVYINSLQESEDDGGNDNIDISISGDREDEEDLYKRAVEIIKRDKRVSTSYIQRQLRIGYNKAANIIERMEKEGIVTPAGVGNKRDIVE
ncbi:MAG: DNA translocase FtsK 4TM domain-containing protein [Rickettsiales bacterium]|jgi:S-DNA-T family DNA segregation ATPase FtsK/SpoIIIE|nr:DNA translocase FtsK 4TM domain-containing protein [Rickettsiales bacterium]